MFSDQGAWFAYALPTSETTLGFSGPFLMTEQNGIWLSNSLSQLEIDGRHFVIKEENSYASHLNRISESDELRVEQTLAFLSASSALQTFDITNTSEADINVNVTIHGKLFEIGSSLYLYEDGLKIENCKVFSTLEIA